MCLGSVIYFQYISVHVYVYICILALSFVDFFNVLLVHLSYIQVLKLTLKELQNRIICIICVWSLFCSARVYKCLHFVPILLENQDIVSLCFLCFFSVLNLEFYVISKYLTNHSGVLSYFFSIYKSNFVKYENHVI